MKDDDWKIKERIGVHEKEFFYFLEWTSCDSLTDPLTNNSGRKNSPLQEETLSKKRSKAPGEG